eukprot:2319964-Amphidinium_carterae.1
MIGHGGEAQGTEGHGGEAQGTEGHHTVQVSGVGRSVCQSPPKDLRKFLGLFQTFVGDEGDLCVLFLLWFEELCYKLQWACFVFTVVPHVNHAKLSVYCGTPDPLLRHR